MHTPYGDIPDRLAGHMRPPEQHEYLQLRYRADATEPAGATGAGTDRQLAGPRGDVPGQGAGTNLRARLAFVPWRPTRAGLPPSAEPRSFNIRQLTDVLRCKLQHDF